MPQRLRGGDARTTPGLIQSPLPVTHTHFVFAPHGGMQVLARLALCDLRLESTASVVEMRFVSWTASDPSDARVTGPALRAGSIVAAASNLGAPKAEPARSSSMQMIRGQCTATSVAPAFTGQTPPSCGVAINPALLDWMHFCRHYRRLPTDEAWGPSRLMAGSSHADELSEGEPPHDRRSKDSNSQGKVEADATDASPAVHRAIRTALSELASQAGADAPLVVIGHSVGAVPAVLHVLTLQRKANRARRSNMASQWELRMQEQSEGEGKRPPSRDRSHGHADGASRALSPLEKGQTICSLFSIGCPLPLYLAQLYPPQPLQPVHSSHQPSSSPNAPTAEERASFSPLRRSSSNLLSLRLPPPHLVDSVPGLGRCPAGVLGWFNLYHPADPLGFPLAPCFDRSSNRPAVSRPFEHDATPSAAPSAVPPLPSPPEGAVSAPLEANVALAHSSALASVTASISVSSWFRTNRVTPPWPLRTSSHMSLSDAILPGGVHDIPVRFHSRGVSQAPQGGAAPGGPAHYATGQSTPAYARLADAMDYLLRPGSRDVLSPIAYTLVHIWLAYNPHLSEALDTAPLEAHREHRSLIRAQVGKQMGRHAAAAASAASRTTQRMHAAASHYKAVRRGAAASEKPQVGELRRSEGKWLSGRADCGTATSSRRASAGSSAGVDGTEVAAKLPNEDDIDPELSVGTPCRATVSEDSRRTRVAGAAEVAEKAAVAAGGRARAAARAAGSATMRSIRTLDAELQKVGGLARKASFGRRAKPPPPPPPRG